MPVSMIREFLKFEAAGGIVLIIAAALALVLANSPLETLYLGFLDTPLAIQVARSDTTITNQEEKILFHARQNVLIDSDRNVWEKKPNPDVDVSMGRAEISKRIEIYMMTKSHNKKVLSTNTVDVIRHSYNFVQG